MNKREKNSIMLNGLVGVYNQSPNADLFSKIIGIKLKMIGLDKGITA